MNKTFKILSLGFVAVIIGILLNSFIIRDKFDKWENSTYANNKLPLLETKYVKLPLGSVKPKGWLRDQLIVQSEGLTGHLPEVWDAIKYTSWKGDTGSWEETSRRDFAGVIKKTTYTGKNQVNVYPECCWARYVPRWLEGLVPLAYQLDDPRLKKMVDDYMGYILNVRDPKTVTPSITAWSHLGRVLPGYYEATGDKRVLALCRRMLDYFDEIRGNNLSPQPEAVQQTRLGMPLSFCWWYYNNTGDTEILEKINWISKNCVDYYRDFYTSPRTPTQHIVDITQSIQYPVMYYLLSKDVTYKNCVIDGMKKLDSLHGQVTGRWNGDEYLSGLSPTQGSELCSITELVYSLVKSIEAIGNVEFADRLESLVFNAVPGTCTGDWWAHQYDQQANQVLVSVDKRTWSTNTNSSNIFGFTPHFPCCLSNMHSSFPNYVQYMWMATGDGGLVASTYGPSEVKAKVVGGNEITISETTDYPFSDQITFTILTDKNLLFPLYLRIPFWTDDAKISVAGIESKNKPKGGKMFKLEREWKNGDVVTLCLNNRVRTQTRMNNSASVLWGPLVFSLRIEEKFQKIKLLEEKRSSNEVPSGVANWNINSVSKWNYALNIDRKFPEGVIVHNRISQIPFAGKNEPIWSECNGQHLPWNYDVPIIIKMKARLIPQWVMNGANADAVPKSPVIINTNDTIVDLIPYGSTRLRISEFPVVKN